MSTKPGEPAELSDLINRATAEAERVSHSQAAIRPAARGIPLEWQRWAVILLLAVAIAVLGREIRAIREVPAPELAAENLGQILDMARASVEEAKTTSGRLPSALPSAALTAVVTYVPDGENYRLSAEVNGVRVSVETDGKKSVDYQRTR